MKHDTTWTPSVNEINLTPFRETREPKLSYSGSKDEAAFFADMTGRVAMVRLGGKVRYLDSRDGELAFYQFREMQQLLKPYDVLINDGGKLKKCCPLTLYIENDNRREYFGVEFQPDLSKADPRKLNTFGSFAVKAARDPGASYALYAQHVRENICNGDEDSERYYWDWQAHFFQRPGVKIGTALILQGDKGSGKSFTGDVLRNLIGEQYCQVVEKISHIAGNFNKHLMNTVFLQVEEALHAANPQHESTIKHLITGSRLMVEPKGIDAFMVDSRLNIMMTTNQRHVVSASGDERRYFVLTVGNGWRQQGHRFLAMRQELERGGYELLMADLMDRDISHRDWSKPPMTEALSRQIVESMRGLERWWCDALSAGRLPFSADTRGDLDTDQAWPESGETWTVDSSVLHASASQWARGYDGAPTPAALGKFLAANVPGLRRGKVQVDRVRSPVFVLPSLEDCRAAFCATRPNLRLAHLTAPVAEESDAEAKAREEADAPKRKAAAEARAVVQVESRGKAQIAKLAVIHGGQGRAGVAANDRKAA